MRAADRLRYRKVIMNELMTEISALLEEGKTREAEERLQSALKQADEEKNYEAYAAIASQMVGFYQMLGAQDKAEAVSDDLLLLLEELQMDQSEYFAMVLLQLGDIYQQQGKEKEAEHTYRRCESLLGQIGGSEEAFALCFCHQGLFYLATEKYESAEEAFKASNEHFAKGELAQDPRVISNIAGIGEALLKQGHSAQALAEYEKALHMLEEKDAKGDGYGLLCENCAVIAETIGDPEKAAFYREKEREGKKA